MDVLRVDNLSFSYGDKKVIDNISLPAPIQDSNDLVIPKSIQYEVMATNENANLTFIVNVYDKLYVVQNIGIVPKMNLGGM